MRSNIFNWNVINRDKFVKDFADKHDKPGIRIIDCGAGDAPYREYFMKSEYYTQDAVPLKAEQLRDREGYTQIDYVSDILNIPVVSESYDIVICTEVLEHVPDPVGALKELSRILKKGGHLLLTAPLGSGLHQEPFHFYGGFTKYWYEDNLKDQFQNLEITPNGSTFDHLSQECLRFIRLSMNGGRLWNLPLLLIVGSIGLLIRIFSLLRLFPPHDGYTVGYHITAVKK